MKGIIEIIRELINNRYRIYSIAKYELVAEMRESRLGIFWNIANPCIQLLTYWFVFGLGLRNGRDVGSIPFIAWMIVGMSAWFFVSPSILKGTSCVYSKKSIISKIKFPACILPVITVLKELFNHVFMLAVVLIMVVANGIQPSVSWLWLIYYVVAAASFCISITMVLSVLNMFTRDVKKLVSACMRMFMYVTPILWTMENIEASYPQLVYVIKANPLYYIVEGYRGSVFFHDSPLNHPAQTLCFWLVVLSLFGIGSYLFYRYKERFIDMY